MDTTKTPKLLMIGVDAAEFSFVKAHLAELPNFNRALGSGVTRRLKSTSALLNGSVWPTFYISGRLRNGRRGNHRADGFLVTMGAGLEHGTDAQPLHITELAPIVFGTIVE
jgi:hypothetical protein